MKRTVASLLAVSVTIFTTAGALGQSSDYPAKPIRWIVPYPAGGGTDVLARALTEAMRSSLGQPIVVDNRPGASTNIGTVALVQSAPDGYTVMQADNAALAFNEHLFTKLSYNPDKDFTYIAALGRFPVALVVHPSFPAKSLKEFIDYVRQNRGKVNYGSPGNGSPHHMAMELFKQRAGLDITHVPYKGAAPAIQDLLGNQIPLMMLDLASGLSLMRSGKVRSLAIALPQRAKALPDVPTFAEQGITGVDAYAFQGIVGPAGMPAEIVKRLNAEVNKAARAPEVTKLFSDFGMESTPGSPEDFRRLARSESARWGQVIKATGVKLD